MKASNLQMLVYSSASKAMDLLLEIDVIPGGVDSRKLEAAINRIEDIKALSTMKID